MRGIKPALSIGLAAMAALAMSACGPGSVLFGVTAADAAADPQEETVTPAPLANEDANLVILLQTGGHNDVTSAQVAIGDVQLITAEGDVVTTRIGEVLPVDLATLDGDCALVSANRLIAGREYVRARIELRVVSVLDSYGQNLAVNSMEHFDVDLSSTMMTDDANTLVINLDLASTLNVDSNAQSAEWNGQLGADVISFESGNYDLGVMPVQSVGGTLAEVDPDAGVMRLIVTPNGNLAVPVVMREGVTVENEFGRGEIVDVTDDVDFTFWPQQTVVLDGSHVTPTLPPDIVVPGEGGGGDGGEDPGTGGDDGGTTEPGDDDPVPGVDDPILPPDQPGVIPPSENPDDYGEHPDDIEIDGGASRVVRTTWDPLMRGIVAAVYDDYFQMLVITTVGPGSPDVFSIVDVNWRPDAFWTREDARTLTDVSLADVTIGQEVLVNTLPMGNNLFEADRIELLETAVDVRPIRYDAEGNTVVEIVRVEGVEPGLLGTTLFGEFVLEGGDVKLSRGVEKVNVHLKGRFLPGTRTFKVNE